MAFDYETVLNWPIPRIEQTLTRRDTILYALGLGLGSDPVDAGQLQYVYEDGLKALPSMATVLGYPGFWMKDPATGIDWRRVLHGEQWIEIHRPLPVEGTIIGESRVTEIVDKGPDKGAIVYQAREVHHRETGDHVATLTMSTFCRGDGGCGAPTTGGRKPPPVPEAAADIERDFATLPQQALIYRLSGDTNPLHADPKVAREAGFDRPILHGLSTLGVATYAMVDVLCEGRPERLTALDLRFSAPVYPGETIRTEIWRPDAAGVAHFRARVVERDIVVLNNGRAVVAAA